MKQFASTIALSTLVIFSGSTLFAACYLDTFGSAGSLGCTLDAHVDPTCSAVGNDCIVAECVGVSHLSRRIRKGTKLVSNGRATFVVGADICYDWRSCECAFIGIQNKCTAQNPTPGAKTWTAQHASGAACTSSGA